jgi:hypothetical protein
VPVVCNRNGSGRCVPDLAKNWVANTTATGYAICETDVWNAAITTGIYKEWDRTTAGFNSQNGDGTYKYPSLHDDNDAPNPLLFIPAAGIRSVHNTLYDMYDGYTGARWYYASSTGRVVAQYGSVIYGLAFGAEGGGTHMNTDYDGIYRVYGYSIRCVEE